MSREVSRGGVVDSARHGARGAHPPQPPRGGGGGGATPKGVRRRRGGRCPLVLRSFSARCPRKRARAGLPGWVSHGPPGQNGQAKNGARYRVRFLDHSPWGHHGGSCKPKNYNPSDMVMAIRVLLSNCIGYPGILHASWKPGLWLSR